MDQLPAGVPATLAGRYTPERELGRGATATVYLAHDRQTNGYVALKILRPELADSLAAKRFVKEISLNDDLDHPRIVRVIDSGEADGQLYFVLPHMSGGSLRERLAETGQLPLREAIAITCDVAEALSYAHKRGYIHRDVKPENILLHDGRAHLADFGIARAIERSAQDSRTTTGFVRGTAAYMSPEQASASANYDGRSDIYSLGCVLYEMLAGMQAFVGPSTESIIAQRFKHTPRDVRVYRPRVPESLVTVVETTLQISPADRYQSVDELTAALHAAERDPAIRIKARKRYARRAVFVPLTAGVLVTAMWAAPRPWQRIAGNAAVAVDTTRFVLLPVEGDTALPLSAAHDLLYSGFARWRGITLVDPSALIDARGSAAPVRADREARRAAASVGAGRYVRSRVTRLTEGLRIWASLYDGAAGARLHEASAVVPSDLRGSDTAMSLLAEELLLRGAVDDGKSRVVPAMQRFKAAMARIEGFNFRGADSLLFAALEADPRFARAALWLSQVRAWDRRPRGEWMPWLERATGDSMALNQRERMLAAALAALGNRDFPAACSRYDGMRQQNASDFAAWYGLGQCRGSDDIVVRDGRSPSGWRFRASSHAAAQAYVRALSLAPAVHRTFEAGAYSSLRDILYARHGFLRRGVSAGSDSVRFLGYGEWHGDTLVHIPYPAEDVTAGRASTSVAARATALRKQRQLFASLAEAWSTALPDAPGTKEALGIALEAVGDRTAVDTLRAGRRLSGDPSFRLRLAAEEVHALVSLGRRSIVHLRSAARLADSLLQSAAGARGQDALMLAPLAAIRGKCRLAGELAARAATSAQATYLNVPMSVVRLSDSTNVTAAAGCRSAGDTAQLHEAVEQITSDPTWRGGRDNAQIEYQLFGRAIMLTLPLDTTRVRRLSHVSAASAMPVLAAAVTGDARAVRATLQRRGRSRSSGGGSADVLLAEAAALLLIGDSAAALEWASAIDVRTSWLDQTLTDPVSAGALVRLHALRADLAVRTRDRHAAREAAGLVAALWDGAEGPLAPVARRMAALAR